LPEGRGLRLKPFSRTYGLLASNPRPTSPPTRIGRKAASGPSIQTGRQPAAQIHLKLRNEGRSVHPISLDRHRRQHCLAITGHFPSLVKGELDELSCCEHGGVTNNLGDRRKWVVCNQLKHQVLFVCKCDLHFDLPVLVLQQSCQWRWRRG